MLSITKLQNLKAIHNSSAYFNKEKQDVINHKTTKFESNSQPRGGWRTYQSGCYQSQNYKIWKQFTTSPMWTSYQLLLLSITKLQNLKAIHNAIARMKKDILVVINHKATKFESNSQLHFVLIFGTFRCYQSQNYKIWKQFTTWTKNKTSPKLLLSITKLQNLKAIHNKVRIFSIWRKVVINRKTTKSESNSQRGKVLRLIGYSCYQSQNYKIWKQFTTNNLATTGNIKLLSITKLQNLKAIHNQQMNETAKQSVVINHKTTKFESNSQLKYYDKATAHSCYQS